MNRRNEDYELVKKIISGSNKDFEILINKYKHLSNSVIRRIVSNPEDIRDLNQECFLQVYRHLHSFRFESSLGTWITHVAHSTACKFIKKKHAISLPDCEIQSLLEKSGHDLDTPTILIKKQAELNLHNCINELEATEQVIIRMHYFEEKSIHEISLITRLAKGTIKSHLSRGRAKLRLSLKKAA